VHSYWDDFFALRGLRDAAWLAERLGDVVAAERYRREHAAMREDVADSIRQTMQDKGLTTIPASADLGDFDPTSTAIALSPTQEDDLLPGDTLRQTFDQYLAMVRKRAAGSPRWPGHTPYEWRNVEALVRLGRNNAVGNGVGSRSDTRRGSPGMDSTGKKPGNCCACCSPIAVPWAGTPGRR